MRSIRIIALCLLCAFQLLGEEKKVELIANFAVDTARLSQALKEKGVPLTIVSSNLEHYSGLQKDKSWLGKVLKNCSLDYPRTVELEPNVAKMVFWNIDSQWQRNHNFEKLPKDKLVLFMWEPPSVLPKMYQAKLHKAFSRIYTWDDSLVDGKKYFKFFYPVLQPMRENLPSFEERELCALFATNIPSKQPHTLYGERKQVIAFFETCAPQDFALYGRGWDPNEYKTYKGYVENKLEMLGQYRFSICYENTASCAGYISEKIFDCFAAGNVPVYWGAANVADYIPKECFIDRRDFASMEELYAYLKQMSKEEYEIYIDNIRSFLSSDQARVFSQEYFDAIFCEAIKN